MKTRILSLLLALILLVSICPVTVVAEEPVIQVAGANMNLGNRLKMNFLIKQETMDALDGTYTAIVTQTRADGKVRELALPQAQWQTMGVYYMISCGIAAKEMADALSLQIVDENGKVCSEACTISVRDYALMVLDDADTGRAAKVMVVDMLNYGAAAQQYFGYGADDLANKDLTEEHQALASEEVALTDCHEVGAHYYGTNLSLEENILLNVYFSGMSDMDVSAMTAAVTFKNYRGVEKYATVPGTEFIRYSADAYGVPVDAIVLADSKQLVTVEVYDGEGELYATAKESVESYVVRAASIDADDLYPAIMKFSCAAAAYFAERGDASTGTDVFVLDDPFEEISLDGNAMGYAYGANMFGEEIVVVSEAPLTDLPTMYNGTVEKVGTADGGIPIYALTDHAQREADGEVTTAAYDSHIGEGLDFRFDGEEYYGWPIMVVDCLDTSGESFNDSGKDPYYDPSSLVYAEMRPPMGYGYSKSVSDTYYVLTTGVYWDTVDARDEQTYRIVKITGYELQEIEEEELPIL